MATKDLEEEYRKLLEENSQYEELIDQLKERLVSLEKETTEGERRMEEEIRVPHIIGLELKKHLKQRETLISKNLETETQKLNDLIRRKSDHDEEVAFLQKLRNNELKAEKQLDQQLTEQRIAMVELESGVSDALRKRSTAEAKMLNMKTSIDEDKLQFKKKKKLKMKAEQNDKLQVFVEKKLQKRVPAENNTEILEQQEPNKPSSRDVVGATGIDPKKMSFTCAPKKKTNLSLTKQINELEKKRSMLEERIIKTKRSILVLKQENTNLPCRPEDLDAELKNLTQLAGTFEEKEKVAQKTLDELAAGISGLLKDVQKPANVTSDNITDCLNILQESIFNLLIHTNRVED